MSTLFVRIDGGLVAELIEIPQDGPPIEERLHPDIVAACVEVPDGVAVSEGWTWDGETFAPPPPPEPAPPVVPASVTRTQGLLALLLGAGITEQAVRDKIALITDPTDREVTRLRFEAASWERTSAFIAWGATEFALSAEQVDGLFIQAAGL